jgi:hypothetical protein
MTPLGADEVDPDAECAPDAYRAFQMNLTRRKQPQAVGNIVEPNKT